MNRTLKSSLRLTLAALLVLLTAGSTLADDRRLITGFEEIPTVLFLFDTSGSMHWSSQCTQADFDAGKCDWLCPTGSCFTPGNGDSPNSKLYQAKAALYTVLGQAEGLNVGFATYNQDDLRLARKHWLYEALGDGPDITGWGAYPRGPSTDGNGNPVNGDWHSFGDSWACTTGNGADRFVGCAGDTPADLNDRWEAERMQALPKETPDFNGNSDTALTTYIRTPANVRWKIIFKIRNSDPHTLGDPTIRTRVWAGRCTNASCSTTTDARENVVDFALRTDYDGWDITTARGPAESGFFAQGTASDGPSSGANASTCGGWDPNTDTALDLHNGYNTRFPTVPDATFTPLLDIGDVLPIDWRNNNRQRLLERLAPNLALGETTPDFRVARYFEDIIVPTNELHLKNAGARPILSFGATPIGASVEDFYNWAAGPTGWVAQAAANDPSAACRNVYLIVLTDGNETCNGDPCTGEGTYELFNSLGIKTFVVAFGVAPHVPILPACTGDPAEVPDVTCCAGAGSTCVPTGHPSIPPEAARDNRFLRCMASTGGTGAEDWDGVNGLDSADGPGVIYPQNQSELVDALVNILDSLKPAPASFSTAAVPSVQAEAADKVFLSEFTPISERSVWQGKVNAFLKPVPVDPQGRPDTSVLCSVEYPGPTDVPTACLLWEAGDVILNDQAIPSASDPVGDLVNQRRLYYSEYDGGVPKTRHFLLPTQDGATPLAQEFDFWRGFDIDFTPGSTPTYTAARAEANNIVDFVTSIKTTPMNADFPVPYDYVLPDIFHSDPLLLGSPDNLLYFFNDLNGYRQFAVDHAFRRRVLVFGTNGGILHGLDAGVCRDAPAGDPRVCVFDNGSGRELFGYIPRIAMPTLNKMTFDSAPHHRYVVDGRTQAIDIFIDPLHDGALSPSDPPQAVDREWRTVVVGGMREGGNQVPEGIGDTSSPSDVVPGPPQPINQFMSGYFALDVTMPDPLEIQGPSPVRPPIPQATGLEPPGCLRTNDGVTPIDPACGTVAYAAPLWEFTDSIEGVRLDEDDNGQVDLAFAWSNPSTGRIRVCTAPCADDEDFEDRYVAIIGGGFDPSSPFARGNHLYIIDMETGSALYKRAVPGAIAAEPAAVDKDFDGYIDTVYIGTTLGELYRLDLGEVDHDGLPGTPAKFPEVVITTITETANNGNVVQQDVERIIDPDFSPHLLLEATSPQPPIPEIRPFFYRPSVIYLAKFNQYAIAVGTGNREDIFRRDQETGRFFVFVDNVTPSQIMSVGFTPFSPTHPGLTPLTPTSPRLEQVDLLKAGEGWWLELETNERLVTEPFALSGILFFSTFLPDPDGPEVIPEESLCRERGVSNVYGVFTSNADGLLADDDDINDPDQLVRYITVTGLVSAPFTEQAQSKNPAPPGQVDTIDDLTARLKYVRDRLKKQFPENCTFPPGYRTDVKTRSSGTELNFIAPVPICVVEKNFREF